MKRWLGLLLALCMVLSVLTAAAAEEAVSRQRATAEIVHMIGLNSFPAGAELSGYADAALLTEETRRQVASAVAAGCYPAEEGLLKPNDAMTGALVNALLGVDARLSGLAVFTGDATLTQAQLTELVAQIDEALTEVTPQDDFYHWANRVMLRNQGVQEGEAWTLYHQMQADAYAQEQAETLKVCGAAPDSFAPGTAAHRLSYLYAQLTDDAARNTAGASPLQPWFDRIDACQTPAELWALLPEMERETGITVFLSILDELDEDTGRLMAGISFYPFGPLVYGEVTDAQAAGYREIALALYESAGLKEKDGAAYDQAVALAQQVLDEPAWDPSSDSSEIALLPAQVDAKLQGFSFSGYLQALGMDPAQTVMLDNSLSFVTFANLMTEENLPAFRLICKHKLLQEVGIYLDDTTAYAAKALGDYDIWCFTGSDEPFQWDNALPYRGLEGEALYSYLHSVEGNQDTIQLFVDTCVPQEAVTVAQEITEELRQTFAKRIGALEWMGEETKANALTKLDQITACLVDYSSGRHIVESPTLCQSMMSLRAASLAQVIEQLSSHEAYALVFHQDPDIVNACYVPEKNAIDVPGALFRWPLYISGDRVRTLGCMGAVIGHELTHGFDPEGSQYDGEGLRQDWWTEADHAAFAQRVQTLVDYYGRFPYRQGMTQDAEQIKGEAIADLGGLNLVMDILDGDVDAQREALIQFAQLWAMTATDEQMDDLAAEDVHPLKNVRVNAAMSALDAFYVCFGVEEGDGMYVAPEDRPQIW